MFKVNPIAAADPCCCGWHNALYKNVVLTGSLCLAYCLVTIICEAVLVSVKDNSFDAWVYYVDFALFGLWASGNIIVMVAAPKRQYRLFLAGFILWSIFYAVYLGFLINSIKDLIVLVTLGVYLPAVLVVMVAVKGVIFILMAWGFRALNAYFKQLRHEFISSRTEMVSASEADQEVPYKMFQ